MAMKITTKGIPMLPIHNVYLQDAEVQKCKRDENEEEATEDNISTVYSVDEKRPLRTEIQKTTTVHFAEEWLSINSPGHKHPNNV